MKLFAPEGSAEGCASGECLPEDTKTADIFDDGPEEAPPPVSATRSPAEVWKAAVEAVRAATSRHGMSLSHARFVSYEPGTLKVAFPTEAAFHRATVFGTSRALVEEALTRHFGRKTNLQEDTSASALAAAPKSIAEEALTVKRARESSIDARVREHPAVRNVMRILGGALEHIQILEAAALPKAADEIAATPDDDA